MADFKVVGSIAKDEIPEGTATYGPRKEYQELAAVIIKNNKRNLATKLEVSSSKIGTRVREGMRSLFRKRGYGLSAIKEIDQEEGTITMYFSISPLPGVKQNDNIIIPEDEDEDEPEDEEDEEEEEPAPKPIKKKKKVRK